MEATPGIDGPLQGIHETYSCTPALALETRTRVQAPTWPEVYVCRLVLRDPAPDAQLAIAVCTPALEAAADHDSACVGISRCNCDGRDT